MTTFPSYGVAIATISQSLREQYMDQWGAKDIYEIGHMYAASPTWAVRVVGFMNQIDEFSKVESAKDLSLSI